MKKEWGTFRLSPVSPPVSPRFPQNSTTTITNYLYTGADMTEEIDASGNETARYAQAAGVDEHLARLRSGAIAYYEQDGIDSVTSLSNNTGTVDNTYIYDTFGNLISSTGAIGNPFQYTGRATSILRRDCGTTAPDITCLT